MHFAKDLNYQRRTHMHRIKQTPLHPPFPDHLESIIFGKGCFWGVEQSFWEIEGVYTTAAGYAGGSFIDPTYHDVCDGNSGHAEVVLVVYNPEIVTLERLLARFWKGHRPLGQKSYKVSKRDQYRSVIYTTTPEQLEAALASRDNHQKTLPDDCQVTTEIRPAPTFYYAEPRHQQYFAKRSVRV
jgi:peptide-methionine (S)-S-oxide reductase